MSIELLNEEIQLSSLAVAELRKHCSGEIFTADDFEYETLRRWSKNQLDHPALIVRCRTAQDVANAVLFARENNLDIVVRRAAYHAAAYKPGTYVLIDLMSMHRISIDRLNRTARIEAGASNGEVVLSAQAYGLAVTLGNCATAGAINSIFETDIGWLGGRFGAAIDSVVAFELVTAEGEFLKASATEHAELFWSLQQGSCVGVVTAVTLQLHKVQTVLGGMLLLPLAIAPLALQVYQYVTSSAPDELAVQALIGDTPEYGPALLIQACYAGNDLRNGERLLAPLRTFGPPPIDQIAVRSYAELYMILNQSIYPESYTTSYKLPQLSAEGLNALLGTVNRRPAQSRVVIQQSHGAASRGSAHTTTIGQREPYYLVTNSVSGREDQSQAEIAWLQDAQAIMAPFVNQSVEASMAIDEIESMVRRSYRANVSRLTAIKRRYDPHNVFRRQRNVHEI